MTHQMIQIEPKPVTNSHLEKEKGTPIDSTQVDSMLPEFRSKKVFMAHGKKALDSSQRPKSLVGNRPKDSKSRSQLRHRGHLEWISRSHVPP